MNRICGIVVLVMMVGFGAMAQETENSKPGQPDLIGDLMLDFGYNYWTGKPSDLRLKGIGSQSVGLYYNYRMEISDRISFYPAVGFTFEKYGFKGNQTWLRQSGSVSLDSLAGTNLDKNKLAVSFFEIPLEFRIHPFKTERGEGFFVGVGGVAGVRIGAHTKIKYATGGDDYKEKLYGDFDLKKYRYGLQFRLGFRSIHFFYKMYMSDVFNSAPDASEVMPKSGTFGINISGF